MGRNCEVCKEVQFKYKCPACLAPYCSVACFKKHKENLCQKLQPPVEESAAKNESTQSTQPLENEKNGSSRPTHPIENEKNESTGPIQPLEKEKNESTQQTPPLENESFKSNVEISRQIRKTIEVEEESWIVSKEQLSSLAECQGIRDVLKGDKLQELILRIDSSEEPEQELNKAMENQSFHEFTEKVLDIISQGQGGN